MADLGPSTEARDALAATKVEFDRATPPGAPDHIEGELAAKAARGEKAVSKGRKEKKS